MTESRTLAGQSALVTGASLGIGAAIAEGLGAAGAKVAINYRSHRDDAERVADAVRASGSEAIVVQGDVADEAAVERMVTETVAAFGGCDIAVGNAVYSDRTHFWELSTESFRRTMDVLDVGRRVPVAGRHATIDGAGAGRIDRLYQLAARLHAGAAGDALQHGQGGRRPDGPHGRHRACAVSHSRQPRTPGLDRHAGRTEVCFRRENCGGGGKNYRGVGLAGRTRSPGPWSICAIPPATT